jgi:hypothetical protein
MVCRPCKATLKARLVEVYGLSEVEADRLATSALERVAARQALEQLAQQQPPEKILLTEGDYYTVCTPNGMCECEGARWRCTLNIDCLKTDACGACTCPDPPKAHSSLLSNTCNKTAIVCPCNTGTGKCIATACACACSGLCYFKCDDPYVWDPVTSECVLPLGEILGDGITFAAT